jgi:hypothetical protein|tara:strand:- start:209 stop:406 length:198 start_codon:yes stop_codon:yes gene_type:complete
MPTFLISIELEVEADDIDQAWGGVAEPFHSNEISVLIPSILNWHIGEAELFDWEYRDGVQKELLI